MNIIQPFIDWYFEYFYRNRNWNFDSLYLKIIKIYFLFYQSNVFDLVE